MIALNIVLMAATVIAVVYLLARSADLGGRHSAPGNSFS
jgi:hypothetical protein